MGTSLLYERLMLSNQSIALLTNVENLESLHNTQELIIDLAATIPEHELIELLIELKYNCTFTSLQYHGKTWEAHEQALMRKVTHALDNVSSRLLAFSIVSVQNISNTDDMLETMQCLISLMPASLNLENVLKIALILPFDTEIEEEYPIESQYFDAVVDFLSELPHPHKLKCLLINIPDMSYIDSGAQWNGCEYDLSDEKTVPHDFLEYRTKIHPHYNNKFHHFLLNCTELTEFHFITSAPDNVQGVFPYLQEALGNYIFANKNLNKVTLTFHDSDGVYTVPHTILRNENIKELTFAFGYPKIYVEMDTFYNHNSNVRQYNPVQGDYAHSFNNETFIPLNKDTNSPPVSEQLLALAKCVRENISLKRLSLNIECGALIYLYNDYPYMLHPFSHSKDIYYCVDPVNRTYEKLPVDLKLNLFFHEIAKNKTLRALTLHFNGVYEEVNLDKNMIKAIKSFGKNNPMLTDLNITGFGKNNDAEIKTITTLATKKNSIRQQHIEEAISFFTTLNSPIRTSLQMQQLTKYLHAPNVVNMTRDISIFYYFTQAFLSFQKNSEISNTELASLYYFLNILFNKISLSDRFKVAPTISVTIASYLDYKKELYPLMLATGGGFFTKTKSVFAPEDYKQPDIRVSAKL